MIVDCDSPVAGFVARTVTPGNTPPLGSDTVPVSEPVALEMANGVLLAVPNAHVAMSTTGIAGPGGATPGKPVGMVCFGFAMRVGDGISSRAVTHVFNGDRGQVRQASVEFALRAVLEFAGVPINRR